MIRLLPVVPVGLLGLALVAGCAGAPAARTSPGPARHVILMVADGAGYDSWNATEYWAGTAGRAFHDGEGWVTVAVSTHAQCDRPPAAGAAPAQDPELVYDPVRAWDATPIDGGVAGYRWLRRAPDSANTATAMSTGRRTLVGAINTDAVGKPLRPTIASLAHDGGRRVGIVTSVPFAHATPAALGGATSPTRSACATLALDLLTSGRLDVIAGCGHPDFDANGRPRTAPGHARWVGGRAVWDHLRGLRRLAPGDTVAAEAPAEARTVDAEDISALDAWTLVTARPAVAALASGPIPLPLLVVPEVALTLQQERASGGDPRTTAPGDDPLLPGVPPLVELTRAALRALADDPDGFFLHVEGGAVDWAMHDHQTGRMIEEMEDFVAAVDAVVAWVERASSWDETLLIVTSDHDHLLGGPDADRIAFQPVEDRGPGNLPGVRWLGDGHSARLVPLFAKGVGAELFLEHATDVDPRVGPYVAQTDIFRVMAAGIRGPE